MGVYFYRIHRQTDRQIHAHEYIQKRWKRLYLHSTFIIHIPRHHARRISHIETNTCTYSTQLGDGKHARNDMAFQRFGKTLLFHDLGREDDISRRR